MKKIFYLLAVVASLTIHQAAAQCTITDLKLKLNGINTITCEATFDLSWTQEINSGNKFAYVHIWEQPAYHTPAANWAGMYANSTHYPMAADLVNTLSTFVVDDNHADNPLIGTVYHPDPTYILPQATGLYIVKVHLDNTLVERLAVQNIKITLPSCKTPQTLYVDVWASQSSNGKIVSCAAPGAYAVINQLKITGLINCSNPPGFQLIMQNNGPAIDNLTWKVYLDYAPYAVLNSTDSMVFASSAISLPANSTTYFPSSGYEPYPAGMYSSTQPLITAFTVSGWPINMMYTMQNGCGPLPVRFTSFTAVRAKDYTLLNWQTATEQHNRGFEIQRKLPGEDFVSIAFIPSGTLDGNSDQLLNYQYSDKEKLSGTELVYYRIRQTDLNGDAHFSETRKVENNKVFTGWLIYPNPATEAVQVMIPPGTGQVDMILNDITGRVIRRWNNVAVKQLEINNLQTGMYVLNVLIKSTGRMVVNKIFVQ